MSRFSAIFVVSSAAAFACGGSDVSTPTDAYANVDDSALTSLHFTASDGNGNAAPLDLTVTDAAKVRAIFDETRALPAPSGTTSCPHDLGVDYHLAFSGPNGTFAFDVHPTGCQIVLANGTGAGWAMQSPQYWGDLAAALGVAATAIYPYVAPVIPTASNGEPCGSVNPYANVDASTLTSFEVTATDDDARDASVPNIDVTVTDPAKVRSLFTETNSFLCQPAGGTSCPSQTGPDRTYHLVFRGPGGPFTFDLQAYDCEFAIAGGVYLARIGGAPYWSDFTAATGILNPDP